MYGGETGKSYIGYRGRTDTTKICPSDVGDHVVWCDNSHDMGAMSSIVSVVPCRTQAVKSSKRPGRAMPFDDYSRVGGSATYATSSGTLTGAEIAGMKRRVVMIEYDGDADGLARLIGVAASAEGSGGFRRWGPALAVVGKGVDIARCAAFLHAAEASFGIWMTGCTSYNTPGYVDRISGHIVECLGDDEPSWLANLRPNAKSIGGARTLVAAALHGYLAIMHGGLRGSGSSSSGGGGCDAHGAAHCGHRGGGREEGEEEEEEGVGREGGCAA